MNGWLDECKSKLLATDRNGFIWIIILLKWMSLTPETIGKIKTKTPNKHSMHSHNSIVIRYNDSSRFIPVGRSHRKQNPNTAIVYGLHTKFGFQSRGI